MGKQTKYMGKDKVKYLVKLLKQNGYEYDHEWCGWRKKQEGVKVEIGPIAITSDRDVRSRPEVVIEFLESEDTT